MYPEIEPYETGTLKVSDIHTLYYELSGNKNGTPVVFLHGGPAAGTNPSQRRYFAPEKYKIVLFDQRGAGKSTPKGETRDNTLWDLVDDIERLRDALQIESWHVFGGSWGSLLALVYAQTHPNRVKSLVLRGVFTGRQSEIDFLYKNGTNHLFPEAWDEFVALVPEEERGDVISAYSAMFNSDDREVQLKAAKGYFTWESSICMFYPKPSELMAQFFNPENIIPYARIGCHYFVNKVYLREGQVLEKQEIDKIRHIPTIVIHGRYDVMTPLTTAYALKKAWPEIQLHIVPDAGHVSVEPGISKLLVEAADQFADL